MGSPGGELRSITLGAVLVDHSQKGRSTQKQRNKCKKLKLWGEHFWQELFFCLSAILYVEYIDMKITQIIEADEYCF